MASFGAVVFVDAYKMTSPSCAVRLNDTPHSEIVNSPSGLLPTFQFSIVGGVTWHSRSDYEQN